MSASITGEPLTSFARVKVPSTTANLGPGCDVFGLALEAYYDTIELRITSEQGIELEVVGVDSDKVQADPSLNSAGLVARRMMARFERGTGVRMRIRKGIPVGKGLGSSAAGSAGAMVGLDRLHNWNLSHNEIVEIAAMGEVASAGMPHADNVAAEGVAISGAGPSMIGVVDRSKASAGSVANAMRAAFESVGLPCHALATRPARGARVIKE